MPHDPEDGAGSMKDGASVLQARGLCVAFERREPWGTRHPIPVLEGVSFELGVGEVMAVIGSSGAGKSVLAHAILGILPKNARIHGELLYRGELLSGECLARARGRELALVPQSIGFLDPLVRGRKAVEWMARRCGLGKADARAAAEKALRRVGFPPEAEDRFPFELSGGMVRRLLLAIALVGNPFLLVADEPTPGLDPEAVRESLQGLRDFADEGKSVLIISHDVAACLPIADRVAVFLDGRIVEVASASAFSGMGEGLEHPYSRALWNALPENGFAAELGARSELAAPSAQPKAQHRAIIDSMARSMETLDAASD